MRLGTRGAYRPDAHARRAPAPPCVHPGRADWPAVASSSTHYTPLRTPPPAGQRHTMGLFTHIVGGALFGLAARVGQLGIQKRNLFESAPVSSNCSRGSV